MRIARWVERLRRYNFTVEYRPGRSNNVPDMLSRLPVEEYFSTSDDDEDVVAFLRAQVKPISYEEISAQSKTDKEMMEIGKGLRTRQPKLLNAQWSSVVKDLTEEDGIVMRGDKICLPTTLRPRAMEIAHDEAHQGMVRTKQRLREIYWWPAMDRNVEEMIRDCRICAESDRVVKAGTAPLVMTPWPNGPWEKLAIDVRGPDGSVGMSNRFAVVVIDYFSKWAEVELMQEVSTSRVMDMLRRLFSHEGIPKCIASDNGSQSTSREFAEFLEEFGIHHQRTAVYHPMGNALVERFNRTLGGFLATAVKLGGDVRGRIATMVGTYNATTHATTGKSPAELLHGKRMRTKLDVAGHRTVSTEPDPVRSRVEEKQRQQKRYADERRAASPCKFEPGEWVKIRKPQCRKGESKYSEPMRIQERRGQDAYQMTDGRVWHRNRMVKYAADTHTKEAARPEPDDYPEETSHRRNQPEQAVMFGLDSFSEEEEDEDVFGTPTAPLSPGESVSSGQRSPEQPSRAPETPSTTRPSRVRRRPDYFGDFVSH